MFSMSKWQTGLQTEVNQLILSKNKNPYKRNTFEYILVNFIVKNIDRINGLGSYTIEKFMGKEILLALEKKHMALMIEGYMLSNLFSHALNLARMNGIIKVVSKRKSSNKKFAVYLEAGMNDLLKDKQYLKMLDKMSEKERRQSLIQVIYINEILKKEFKIPSLTTTRSLINGKYQYEIKISNLSYEEFQQIKELKIPIKGWSYPYANDDWAQVSSRGLFHHIGDEIGFMIAAMQYGECYVIGKDEMGDLVILSSCGKQTYKKDQLVSAMDFDYVYGVPQGHSFHINSNVINASDQEDCLINTKENSEYADNFWKNKVFSEMSNREMKTLSFSQLVEKIKNDNIKSLGKATNKKFNLFLNKILNDDLSDFVELSNLYKDLVSTAYDYHSKDIEFKVKNTNNFKKENIVLALLANYGYNLITVCSNKKIWKQYKKLQKLLNENNVELICAGNDPFIIEVSNTDIKIKAILNKFIEKIEQYGLNLLNSKYIDELEVNLENETSFFYKTMAHKTHCEIINPSNVDKLGFFQKNDGNAVKETRLNAVDFLFFMLNKNKLIKDVFSTYVYIKLTSFLNKEQNDLYKYWSNLDCPAFFVSDVIDMQNEYRMFIINHRVVATSPCFRNSTPLDAWQNGRFDPRLCNGHNAKNTYMNQETRDRVAKYAKFARKFCKRMKEVHPQTKNYVLDVAWSDDLNKVEPIEINSITWSGAYQINFDRVCAAVADVPYRYEYEHLLSIYSLRKNAWNRMKNDGLIAKDDYYELNGLERTNSTFANYLLQEQKVKESKIVDEDFCDNFHYDGLTEIPIEKLILSDKEKIDKIIDGVKFVYEDDIRDSFSKTQERKK